MWETTDLNWCRECWFNARVECRKTKIGINYLCLHCTHSFTDPLPELKEDNPLENFFGSLEDNFRYFDKDGEEWKKWQAKYQEEGLAKEGLIKPKD